MNLSAWQKDKNYNSEWAFLEDICGYFYENRNFYQKALRIEGQNSFTEYFRDLLIPMIGEYMGDVFQDEENWDFYVQFFTVASALPLKNGFWKKNRCFRKDLFF